MSDDENDLRSFIRGVLQGEREPDYRRSNDRDRDRSKDRDRDRDYSRDRDRGERDRERPRDDQDRRAPPRRREEDDGPLPELYSIHKGKVMSVQSFGVFVQIEGFRKQGLVHVSHISKHRVEDPKGVVNEGDPVWVKVVSVEDADGKKKLGLSMKFVNQTDGHDLDINNVELTMSQKKTRPASYDRKPIEFGHALPTTCAKCGSAGHYTKECFSSGEKYELLPDEGGAAANASAAAASSSSSALKGLSASSDEFKRKVAAWEAKHGGGGGGGGDSSQQSKKQRTEDDDRDKKHHKKEKKEKKDKHHKKHKKEKKDKHHKKEKKHKHHHDSSSSSSSSD